MGFQCVQYKGPENVGLCKDTKVGPGIIPASWVPENPLAWPTGASLCILQPQGRQVLGSKFPLGNMSNYPCPDAPLHTFQFRLTSRKPQTDL